MSTYEIPEKDAKTLTRIADLLADPRRPVTDLLDEMLQRPIKDGAPHPVVAAGAQGCRPASPAAHASSATPLPTTHGVGSPSCRGMSGSNTAGRTRCTTPLTVNAAITIRVPVGRCRIVLIRFRCRVGRCRSRPGVGPIVVGAPRIDGLRGRHVAGISGWRHTLACAAEIPDSSRPSQNDTLVIMIPSGMAIIRSRGRWGRRNSPGSEVGHGRAYGC